MGMLPALRNSEAATWCAIASPWLGSSRATEFPILIE